MVKLFERILGPKNVFHATGQYLYTPPTILADYRMVTGHFRFTRGPFHDHSRQYLTLLRDPLDRILSAYYYYRSRPEESQPEQVLLAKRHTFEEFIELPDAPVRILVDNHQTCSFGLADSRTYGLQGISVLRAAIEVLESYDFVGVYEYFPQSVAAMCRQMGWSAVKRIPHLNKTTERGDVKDLSRGTRDRLLSMNGMDHELYQYFKKKFVSWFPVESQPDAAQEARCSAGAALLDSGCGKHQTGGRLPARWSGQSRNGDPFGKHPGRTLHVRCGKGRRVCMSDRIV